MAYILVVDDERAIRSMLRRRLERWGYTVKEAASATDALEILLAEPAVIALLDISMPGHDGLWLADRIRASWPQIPIIIASGAGDIELVQQSKKVGAVDYVLKPFDETLLRQAMERAARAASETPAHR